MSRQQPQRDTPSRHVDREEVSAIARLGVPLAGVALADNGMALTDMAIVGRLGALELAVVGLSAGLAFETLYILLGLLTVVSVLIAEAVGADDRPRIIAIIGEGIRITVLLSIPMVALCLALPWLLTLTPQDPGVALMSREYLHALVWTFPLAMVFGVQADAASALDRARSVFAVSFGAVILNVPLSWVLVFGFEDGGGIGIAGAGYATSLVHLGMVLAMTVMLVRDKTLAGGFTIKGFVQGDRPVRRDIMRLGLPVSGLSLVESGLFSVLAVLVGGFGAAVLAAHKIVFGFVEFAGSFGFAIGDAATIRVARAIGAEEIWRARRVGQLSYLIGGGLHLLFAVWLVIDPDTIAWVFLGNLDDSNAEAYRWTSLLAGIGAAYLFINGLQIIGEHSLRGVKDTLVPMWLGAAGLWGVGLLGGLILAYGLDLDAYGFWYGLTVGSAMTAALYGLRFMRLTRNPGVSPLDRR